MTTSDLWDMGQTGQMSHVSTVRDMGQGHSPYGRDVPCPINGPHRLQREVVRNPVAVTPIPTIASRSQLALPGIPAGIEARIRELTSVMSPSDAAHWREYFLTLLQEVRITDNEDTEL